MEHASVYSLLMLAALIMGPHSSVSARRRAPRSAGPEHTMVTPSRSNLALIAGSPSTPTVSALILCTMSGDVFAGPSNAYHPDTSKPGRPDSAKVGNSGAVEGRSIEVTASPRTWFVLAAWGSDPVVLN